MRVRRIRLAGAVALLALAAALVAAAATPASAQTSADDGFDRNDQIVLNGRLVVPNGITVSSAAIFNGPAIVQGTVQQSLFVLHGRVDISGTVQQDVVVIDGVAVVRSTAHIGGDLVTRGRPLIQKGARIDGNVERVSSRFDFESFGVASRFVWWVGYSASTLFLGLLLLLLFPSFDAAVVRVWRQYTGRSIGWGAAVFFLFPLVAVLFAVTVVGIPLGLFMLLAIGLLYTIGYVAGAQLVGRLILKPPKSRYLAFLLGWLILRVIALVPILGALAFLVVSVVGLGILLVAARRSRAETAVDAAPPPPPPPNTVTA